MATYDAVTLPELKGALGFEGTADDEALARLISASTLEIERRLGTQFVQRSVTEYHEGGCKRLYLQRTPIVSVASITDPSGTVVPASEYLIRQQRWVEHVGNFGIAFATGGQPTDWIVVFTAGWFASTSAVAPDVKAEVVRAIGSMWESPTAGVASVGVGDLSISYGNRYAGQESTSPAIDAAVSALHAYRGVLL